MKLYYALAFSAAAVTAGSAHGGLVITGLADPEWGSGDMLELYATTAIADLSIYGLERVRNDDSSTGTQQEALSTGTLASGDFYYVTAHSSNFETFFGFEADQSWSGLSLNGNDSIVLYQSSVAIDRVLGDADDTDIHGDGWIYRQDGTGPSTTYAASDWAATRNSLESSTDTHDDADILVPIGTYQVPEPGSLALIGLGGLLIARRRRG